MVATSSLTSRGNSNGVLSFSVSCWICKAYINRPVFPLQIFQGLLCVFYNLGDGDYNLTLPTYRLDNGEWHEVFLDRHDNEMTLRMDGGGGQREVSGLQGRSREIIIDPTVVMLGNTFPSGINKSFQGRWLQHQSNNTVSRCLSVV